MYFSEPIATIPKTVPTQSAFIDSKAKRTHKWNSSWSHERLLFPKHDLKPTDKTVGGSLGY